VERFAPGAELDRYRALVADAFLARLGETVDRSRERYRNEVPELGDLEDPTVWETIRELTLTTRRLQADFIRVGQSPEELSHDAAIAAGAAGAGVSLNAVVRAYHIAGSVCWEAWLAALAEVPAPPQLGAEAIAAIGGLVREYDVRLMGAVQAAYEATRDRNSVAGQRLRTVRELLEGERRHAEGLGFDVGAEHVALIVSGTGAEGAVERLRDAFETRPLAVQAVWVEPAPVWWLWVAGARGEPDAALRRLGPLPGAVIAVGESGSGPEWFRRTHLQAGDAHRVAVRLGERLVFYRDVAFEAAVLADEDRWQELAARELGALDDEGATAQRLRRTLAAYFAAGRNAASAAAAMGVHESTVARHLRAVEEYVGAAITQRGLELEVALRVRALRPAHAAEAAEQPAGGPGAPLP
jgi:hypothetical protein